MVAVSAPKASDIKMVDWYTLVKLESKIIENQIGLGRDASTRYILAMRSYIWQRLFQ
jgi:hypothetical protein